jgi:hypothetical protein
VKVYREICLCLVFLCLASPLLAQAPAPGLWAGQTNGGKPISVMVGSNSQVTGWTVGYVCNGASTQKSFSFPAGSCPIFSFGTFECGDVSGCFLGSSGFVNGSFLPQGGNLIGAGSVSDADHNPCCDVTFSFEATPPASGQPGCTPGNSNLCLGSGRFKVEATWQTAANSGIAGAVGLTSDTGYFWFFSSTNVEAVVKVLDACSFNNRYWVFAGGLTDVRVDLKITDTKTGTIKTYSNPLGTKFAPIQDTNALAVCP